MVPWDAIITATDNLFNRFESNYQNRKNRDLTRELWQKQEALSRDQMAATRKQFDDQLLENRYLQEQSRQWQLEDIQSERAWNSTKAVVQRMRDAGINPYLAMNAGAAGQMAGAGAGSPAMASHALPAGGSYNTGLPSGQVDNQHAYFSEGIGAAFSRDRQVDADVTRTRTLNFLDAAKTLAYIKNSNIDTAYKDALTQDVLRGIREGNDTFSARKEAYDWANKLTKSNIDLNTAQSNMYDASSLELLSRAGLNRAQASEIVNLSKFKAQNLVAQSAMYISESEFNRTMKKLNDWWLTPNFYMTGRGYTKYPIRPVDLNFGGEFESRVAQTVLEIKQAAHYGEMTREAKVAFDDFIEHWLHPMLTNMSYGAPYAVEHGATRGTVKETVEETFDGKGKRQNAKRTVQRRRLPIRR